MTTLPEPIPVPWTMKPFASAGTRIEHLDDRRLRMWIKHDVLHGVTPEMLVWWFQNIEGDMEIEGRVYPRYRVWHPLDHVGFAVHQRVDGLVAPGAIFHIHEVLARNPAWEVDVLTDVRRLDAGGFSHEPRWHGMHLAKMEYTFSRVPGGTQYENSLVVGLDSSFFGPLLNDMLTSAAFDEAHGRAWLLHNIEEVGNFEFFLPALYAKETGALA